MSKHNSTAVKPFGDTSAPLGFYQLLVAHVNWLAMHNFSPITTTKRAHYVRAFGLWCIDRDIVTPCSINKPMIESFQRHLFTHRQPNNGKPLAWSSQHLHLKEVKQFFSWLAKQNYIPFSPAAEIELPKQPKTLPKATLSVDEVERILQRPDTTTPLGLRDRAIFEVLYSTGIRRAEVCALLIDHIHVDRQVLFINQGKGQKDRYVPIGLRALLWIARYVEQSRDQLAIDPKERTLFLTVDGKPIDPDSLTDSQRRGTDSSFYLCDGINNVRKLTDATQAITDEYNFDAWGQSTRSTGSTANSQQYKGQYLAYHRDPDAGPEVQYALHHRNYDPKSGRLTSADPAEDDLNLYRMVSNNPVNRQDPSGLHDGAWDERTIRLIIRKTSASFADQFDYHVMVFQCVPAGSEPSLIAFGESDASKLGRHYFLRLPANFTNQGVLEFVFGDVFEKTIETEANSKFKKNGTSGANGFREVDDFTKRRKEDLLAAAESIESFVKDTVRSAPGGEVAYIFYMTTDGRLQEYAEGVLQETVASVKAVADASSKSPGKAAMLAGMVYFVGIDGKILHLADAGGSPGGGLPDKPKGGKKPKKPDKAGNPPKPDTGVGGTPDAAPKRVASNPKTGRVDFEHPDYDGALAGARMNAGSLGANTKKMYDPKTGTLIGEMSADGKRGWRIDSDQVNWWDWTGGKKGAGGKYGHEFFPPNIKTPHSEHIGYAPWE